MAVDANVLIFERLKEELRYGKPLGKAIDEGFKRAWPSIRDGNYSTLITCFILIQFTTSIVRGFALTLGLGILMSIFSAIVVTKNLLKLVAGKRLENNSWLMGVKKPKENNN
jgi:preprotein translocase subunit SecD